MKTVLLSAPSYDGKTDVWHTTALVESAKLCLANNINLIPIYLSYDSLVQRARNDVMKMMIDNENFDELVMADCDVDWSPEDLLRIIQSEERVVGGIYPKKADNLTFPVKAKGDLEPLRRGDEVVEVDGLGAGFIKITREVIEKVWEASEEYTERDKGTSCRMVFDVKIVDGELWSEDIVFFEKLKALGEKIHLMPNMTLGHTGIKRWTGNFSDWVDENLN
jgi:hypothetical protein